MSERKKYGQIYLLSNDETVQTEDEYNAVVFEAPDERCSFVVALLEDGLKISLNDTGIKSDNLLLHIDTKDNTLTIFTRPENKEENDNLESRRNKG